MPYESNKDLPDSIKNSLPADAQDIWRNAFNSGIKQFPGNEEKANKIAWGAVKNAGWEKDESDNWKKMNSELKDIEIFSTGIHKGIKFVEKDLDEIVRNFYELKEFIKPVLKIAHKNKMHKEDGQPSLGWGNELKRIGSKLIASFTDVPEIVKKAIDKKLYKRVSSEIYDSLNIGGKKYKRVLSGVGILGADIPAVKNLKDIEVFFADDNQEPIAYSMDVSNGVIIQTEEVVEMSEDLKKSFEERLKLLEEKHEAQLKKFTEDHEAEMKKFSEEQEAKIVEKETEIAELKAANLKRENENKIEAFKTFCEAQVSAGIMFPPERDIYLEDIDKIEFTEGQEFSIPFDKFKKATEKRCEIFDKTERGIYKPSEKRQSSGKTFSEKSGGKLEFADLDMEANKIMAERKCSYEDAVAIALQNNPTMAHRFTEAGFREEDQ